MLTVQIQDPYLEERVKKLYKGNINNFISKVRYLFENEERELAKAYERGDLSTGQIAQKLNITKEEVLKILKKHNIDYVDYNLEEDMEVINYFIDKVKEKKENV